MKHICDVWPTDCLSKHIELLLFEISIKTSGVFQDFLLHMPVMKTKLGKFPTMIFSYEEHAGQLHKKQSNFYIYIFMLTIYASLAHQRAMWLFLADSCSFLLSWSQRFCIQTDFHTVLVSISVYCLLNQICSYWKNCKSFWSIKMFFEV